MPPNFSAMSASIEPASAAGSVIALGSIAACLRTLLGPQGTLKFAEATPTDGALLTGDALTILDRLDIAHPAGTLLVEACEGMASSQGCGITTLICLTGELAKAALNLQQQVSCGPKSDAPHCSRATCRHTPAPSPADPVPGAAQGFGMHAVLRALRWAVEVCRSVSDDLSLPLAELATAPVQRAATAVVPPAAAAAAAEPPADTAAAVMPPAAAMPPAVAAAAAAAVAAAVPPVPTASESHEPAADDDTSWFFDIGPPEPPSAGTPPQEQDQGNYRHATHDSAPRAAAVAAVEAAEAAEAAAEGEAVLALKERGNALLKQGQPRQALELYAAACAACERYGAGSARGADGEAESLAVILANSSLVR